LSRNHQKQVERHVWQDYIETCDDIRHDLYYREVYKLRKETIERVFGTAKEMHGMRYTHLVGKEMMVMKVGLTYACMNMKKLANMLTKPKKKDGKGTDILSLLSSFWSFLSDLVGRQSLRAKCA
jgi:hypothetical protein